MSSDLHMGDEYIIKDDSPPELVGKIGDNLHGCFDQPFPSVSDGITLNPQIQEINAAVNKALDGMCIKFDGKQ